jgi:transcriptional regulator with XRE-family HTH domain
METKDRIKKIMEDQQMTQQEFADFLQQSPATLSSIFNGRTRPTLNIVDSIKAKIPDISIEWLLYGTGEMRVTHPEQSPEGFAGVQENGQDLMLNFDNSPQNGPLFGQNTAQNASVSPVVQQNARNLHPERGYEEIRMVEKEPRRVTEIRVYYDDQTYETFVPAKK